MKASVVIPVWNGAAFLPQCLEALLAQDGLDFEVIAVDNASTDASAELIATRFPKVRLVKLHANRGFAGGCNVGLRVAQGELLVLLNQDTRVWPGWLARLAEAVADPRVGVAGCKTLYPDEQTIQHAGGWVEWPLALARHYGHGEPDRGQWDEPRVVEYVTGAAVAFRRDVVNRVGLLDEGFWPGYFEDADFCFRVREAGYEIRYVPEAVLTHHETTSLVDPAARSRAYHRGRLRFVLKHLPPERFFADFLPAERVYVRDVVGAEGPGPLAAAYLGALLQAPGVLSSRWQASSGICRRVLESLADLYRRTWTVSQLIPGGNGGLGKGLGVPPETWGFPGARVGLVGRARARVWDLLFGDVVRQLVAWRDESQRAMVSLFDGVYQLVDAILELAMPEVGFGVEESTDVDGSGVRPA